VFHSPEGVALQEAYHLFSERLVVSGYRSPSLSVAMISSGCHSLSQIGVHDAVDQRLCNLRPVFRPALWGPLEAHHHTCPGSGQQGLKEDSLQKDYVCSSVLLRCVGRKY